MKRILIGIAMSLVLAGSAAAEINTTKGSRSLVFSFDGLSNLGAGTYDVGTTPSIVLPGGKGDVSAGGIGLRHFIGDGTAIRPGVTFAFVSDSFEPDGGDENKTSAFSLGLNAVLEKFMAKPTSRVAPYMGVGAGFGFSSGKVEVGNNEDKSSAFGFGALGVLGFVAEIFDGVELGAEYQGGIALQSNKVEFEREAGTSEADGSSFQLGIGTLAFMLSVDLQ